MTFNQMAASLDATYRDLEQLNIGLEEKVQARTEELRRQQEQLQEVNLQLEIANRHKSEFLANMSHELRTPLNAVIGFSEVLLDKMFGDLNAKQEEYLDDILSSGRYLLSLINDILDLVQGRSRDARAGAGHVRSQTASGGQPGDGQGACPGARYHAGTGDRRRR